MTCRIFKMETNIHSLIVYNTFRIMIILAFIHILSCTPFYQNSIQEKNNWKYISLQLTIQEFLLAYSVAQVEKIFATTILFIYTENNIIALMRSMLLVTSCIRRNKDRTQSL